MFENNDPAVVRDLAMDGALAGKAAYQLDWSGTWELDTGMPFCELQREDPAPLKVIIRFELPVPIRVEKLLTTGFGLSRTAVRGMVDSGRIRLPMAIDAKAREDFTLFVIATPPPSRGTVLAHQRGQRHVHDCGVQVDDQSGQARCGQDEPLAIASA